MELKDTVDLMTSSDYKNRFKAEYYQVKIRVEKLDKLLQDFYGSKLDFTPTSSIDLLQAQLTDMKNYMHKLEYRAEAEGIEL
jgi:hypothetical protein|nr:MAG TPA: hypothetical protein [Caudoviricetes sp.]